MAPNQGKPMSSSSSVRYNDSDLNYFRSLLIDRIEKEQAELQYLRHLVNIDINQESNGGASLQESQEESFAKDRNHYMEMISRKVKLLQHLKDAMIRIENKTYGICRITGKLIDKERLKLVPHATLSREAKEKGLG